MGLRIAIVGCGSFGKGFVDLFAAHPGVDAVALCDREPQRLRDFADYIAPFNKFNDRLAFTSLEDVCAADLDAVAVFTQPWLHAPQCVRVMESGKHVYSAVPVLMVPDSDEILQWCDTLVETVRRTGQTYMLGETTFYRPQTVFCRKKAAQGAFGDFLYAEGEYFHDVERGLRQVHDRRGTGAAGREWLEKIKRYTERGILGGPMHYPTHSTSGPVCVMNAHAVKVTAHGTPNRNGDLFFADSAFSNEVALFEMSNASAVRIIEFREAAGSFAESETFRIVGTRGTFNENTWKEKVPSPDEPGKIIVQETKMTPAEMRDELPDEFTQHFGGLEKLIETHGSHGGSHPYLVHEFIEAVSAGRQPAINVWQAVRYMAMGAAAHKSALRGGERLEVPDWGDGPG